MFSTSTLNPGTCPPAIITHFPKLPTFPLTSRLFHFAQCSLWADIKSILYHVSPSEVYRLINWRNKWYTYPSHQWCSRWDNLARPGWTIQLFPLLGVAYKLPKLWDQKPQQLLYYHALWLWAHWSRSQATTVRWWVSSSLAHLPAGLGRLQGHSFSASQHSVVSSSQSSL